MDVQVVRSARRRKTVEAREVGGVIKVSIPSWMSEAEERHHVERVVTRLERRRAASVIDIEARARQLADTHSLPRPTDIRWVDNQEQRWGSCCLDDGRIRLSSRLARFPLWVVDYVIVHELAHLAESGHTPRFWTLVNRYGKAERARGFLIAKGLDGDDAGL
jgi:predicted metal-dependent hydrolase